MLHVQPENITIVFRRQLYRCCWLIEQSVDNFRQLK